MIPTAASLPAPGPAPVAGRALAPENGTDSFSAIFADLGRAGAPLGANSGAAADGALAAISGGDAGNSGKAGGKNLPDEAASTADAAAAPAVADPAAFAPMLAGALPMPLPPQPGAGPMTFARARVADGRSAPAARQPASPPAIPHPAAGTAPAAPVVALAPVEIVAEQAAQPGPRPEEAVATIDTAPAAGAIAPVAVPASAGAAAGTPQAPAAPAAAPAAEQAQDFQTLVSRLAEAREAASPHLVRTAIAHAEFGQISLQFRHEDNGLSVTMANGDPAFAGAVQAAAQAGGAGQDSDRSGPQQNPQHGASPQSAQGGAGGGQHSPSRSGQAGTSAEREAGGTARAQDSEGPELLPGRDHPRRGGGIYA